MEDQSSWSKHPVCYGCICGLLNKAVDNRAVILVLESTLIIDAKYYCQLSDYWSMKV